MDTVEAGQSSVQYAVYNTLLNVMGNKVYPWHISGIIMWFTYVMLCYVLGTTGVVTTAVNLISEGSEGGLRRRWLFEKIRKKYFKSINTFKRIAAVKKKKWSKTLHIPFATTYNDSWFRHANPAPRFRFHPQSPSLYPLHSHTAMRTLQ